MARSSPCCGLGVASRPTVTSDASCSVPRLHVGQSCSRAVPPWLEVSGGGTWEDVCARGPEGALAMHAPPPMARPCMQGMNAAL
eukprot:353530-Chlamydomonas_euryale.AAC.2